MNKKCAIYREILARKRTAGHIRFTQKELAQTLGISTSTVFHALKTARDTSIIRVTGRFFVLQDYRKLLYLFATERNLTKDIADSWHLEGSPFDIESVMPPGVRFGLYSAARFFFPTMPVEYDHVYIYARTEDIESVRLRVEQFIPKDGNEKKGSKNFFIITPDPLFSRYAHPLFEQIFADVWNAPEWYAKDILKACEETIETL